LALLDEVVRRADPDAVARQLGAPPATAELEGAARSKLEREKKRLTAHRETLARAERLRADVCRALGRWDEAWRALAEARRWDPETGDRQTRALEAELHEQAGHLGLALEALNTRLKDAPGDRKLREQRVALYEKLGWTEEAARERLRLALHLHQKSVLDERF
jgi:tetratricopeptide (TPR) repeat protein